MALRALNLVHDLQQTLVRRLEQAQHAHGVDAPFGPRTWERDEGRHGGGERLGTDGSEAFDRASVNTSAVHYDDLPDRKLAGATALSAIVHPRNPHAPSMHMHISFTELRDAPGTWRIMADLNPSIPYEADREAFLSTLREVGPRFDEAAAQGDRYFAIPALGRTRGVAHFYLEGYRTSDVDADEAAARRFGEAVIATYGTLIQGRMATPVTAADRRQQLDYHTLYLFQVLTLDRGTTSGLMVHAQNDVGIMGSLPSTIDRALLASWANRVPAAQKPLVEALVACLPDPVSTIDEPVKARLAAAVRDFYRTHPEALELQARGNIVPPTVDNHR